MRTWTHRSRLRQAVETGAWPIPVGYLLLAGLLGILLPRLDESVDDALPAEFGAGAAQALLTAFATGLITVMGFIISVVIAGLTFSGTTVTPRIVREMQRNTRIQHVFGLLLLSVVYAFLVLNRVAPPGHPDQVPDLAVWLVTPLLVLDSLALLALVREIGHALRLVESIDAVHERIRDVVGTIYPDLLEPDGVDEDLEGVTGPGGGAVRNGPRAGVVASLDVEQLVGEAGRAGTTLHLACPIGSYVPAGGTLFQVCAPGPELDEDLLRRAVAIADERTIDQDPLYGLRLLADIAARALSPAVNDPTTAVQALDRIEDVLRLVASRRLDSGTIRDEGGEVRLVVPLPGWQDYLDVALTEIRQYGGTSTQVLRRLRAVLQDLVRDAPPVRGPALAASWSSWTPPWRPASRTRRSARSPWWRTATASARPAPTVVVPGRLVPPFRMMWGAAPVPSVGRVTELSDAAGGRTTGLAHWLPVARWLPTYQRRWVSRDALAGITVWALMVPEAMAYAGIAGVPVQYGLYTIPLALVGYALFGSSRELVVGPSAAVVALSAAAVGSVAVAQADPQAYVALTAALALVVGVLYLVGGLARLGWIEHLFARPVLDGFIIGLGLFVAVGQLPKLVGIDKPEGNTVAVLLRTLAHLADWNRTAVALGASALALLLVLKRWAPRVPGAIVAVVLSILCVKLLHLDDSDVPLVGKVPTGFDFVPWSALSWSDVWSVLPDAVAIIVVGFAESIAIAKAYATEHGYAVDANQEMVAYGAANLGAGALQGFAVCGSLSKSAAAQEARARTQVASLVTAGVVLLTVLFLAGLFQYLPEPVLGAIVIEAVVGMIAFGKLAALRAARSAEFWAALGALLGVVLIDVYPGVVIGVALSFVLLIHALDHPRISRLGRSQDGTRYADLEAHPDLLAVPDLVIERFEGPLVFTNAELLVAQVREHVAAAVPPPRAVVLDFEAVTQVDVTGSDALRRLHDVLEPGHVGLALARVPATVHEALDRNGTLGVLGAGSEYPTVRAAAGELSAHLAPE